MTAALLAFAAAGLVLGTAALAWPVRAGHGPADAPARAAGLEPGRVARRIAGAMIVGASLFLGGFTLAFTLSNA